jgi:glycosyltransferase involved in cell wall biosynthesis
LLVGTSAHNSHVQNMVQALYETGSLYAYFSGGVDVWHGPALKRVREWVGHGIPVVGRELSRRAVRGIPDDFVRARWRWELPRSIAGRFSAALRVEDWLWERGERDLERLCASVIRDPQVGGFFGVEHGALAAVEAAQSLGKPTVVAFLSPHHRTRARWVDAEFDRHPELGRPGRARLDDLSDARDARRDDEAMLADWVVSGSSFTTRSLVDAGIARDKILTIPLGGPDPIAAGALPAAPPRTMRFMYAGSVSAHKGAHYLLRAWRRVAAQGVELHFYGRPLLPESVLADAQAAPGGDRLFFHGSVPVSTLNRAYLDASLLILPTLCDGFGQVVTEALAHGLPVLTTTNAGAADRIEHGANGFVIPPADETALAECLSWCASHPQDVWQMRASALARASGWTWTDFRRTFSSEVHRALDASETGAELAALA